MCSCCSCLHSHSPLTSPEPYTIVPLLHPLIPSPLTRLHTHPTLSYALFALNPLIPSHPLTHHHIPSTPHIPSPPHIPSHTITSPHTPSHPLNPSHPLTLSHPLTHHHIPSPSHIPSHTITSHQSSFPSHAEADLSVVPPYSCLHVPEKVKEIVRVSCPHRSLWLT